MGVPRTPAQGLIVFSRLGVYLRLPGVDVERFSEAMQGSGILGYIDTLSGGGWATQGRCRVTWRRWGRPRAAARLLFRCGLSVHCLRGATPASFSLLNSHARAPAPAPPPGGSISKVGVFSLGIVPYINASILLQLLATAFPSLKKLQREEGPQGRARFQQYQKLAALVFAVAQAVGQLTYLRPFVDDFSPGWLAENTVLLTAGSMILVYVSRGGGGVGWGGRRRGEGRLAKQGYAALAGSAESLEGAGQEGVPRRWQVK